MKTIIIVTALLALTGCASISGEKMQPITVQALHDNKEIAGAGCTLTNDAGSWFLTTPGSVTVHKSTGDLAIDCKKDDVYGRQTLVSKSNGAVWGNILIGGGVGYIIDRNTGAGFDYPATTTIVMRKMGDASLTAPVATASATAGGSTAVAK
jgi:hypothetical protein